MRRLTACLALALLVAGCDRDAYNKPQLPRKYAIGDAHRGAVLINYYGCGGCHEIPGIPNAVGMVGPPLNGMARRIYIAGVLRNTPDNLEHWIEDPQSVVPGNVMPKMGIGPEDARDITAYLYTRK